MLATLLELLGFFGLIASAAIVSYPLGLLVASLGLFVIGYVLEHPTDKRPE